MGNQCTNRCKREEQNNPYHRVIQQFQEIVGSETLFKQKRAITDVRSIAFPLSTSGSRIIDGFNRRVKLAFITWKGCETKRYCLDGLEVNDLDKICQQIKQLGFNGVKLIYSVQLQIKNPKVKDRYLISNPKLLNKHALDILDVSINRITKNGLMVILTNHCSSPSHSLTTSDGQGLWWTDKYSQFQWLDCHKHMVKRYSHNPRVIGFQLRNHIRGTHKIDPTWGDNNMMSDWRRAAQTCTNQILTLNQHCLVFISGLNYGCNLKFLKDYPLDEVVCNKKIVYSGSFLTKHWQVLSWRMHNYQSFVKQIKQNLLCMRTSNYPVFISEFSYEYQVPWNYMMKFLLQSDTDWCYSSFDLYNVNRQSRSITLESKLKNPEVVNQLNIIQQSNCGSPILTNYATANLPAEMLSSNLVQVTQANGYNVDQLLDSTPGQSLDDIKPQYYPQHFQENKGQIFIDQNGVIEKPIQVIKQPDSD